MTIVSNTSPISNLAYVGQISLLQQLYETVLIPTAVHEELLDERAGETVITAVRVYYDVDEEESIVDIRAIGIKQGNQVRIGGEIIEL